MAGLFLCQCFGTAHTVGLYFERHAFGNDDVFIEYLVRRNGDGRSVYLYPAAPLLGPGPCSRPASNSIAARVPMIINLLFPCYPSFAVFPAVKFFGGSLPVNDRLVRTPAKEDKTRQKALCLNRIKLRPPEMLERIATALEIDTLDLFSTETNLPETIKTCRKSALNNIKSLIGQFIDEKLKDLENSS
jgi:hypothetical protein